MSFFVRDSNSFSKRRGFRVFFMSFCNLDGKFGGFSGFFYEICMNASYNRG